MKVTSEFLVTGGNRNPAAADWDVAGLQLLAYGADESIALWDPQDARLAGVRAILHGHKKTVNAVKFFPAEADGVSVLLTGAADHSLRIWRGVREPELRFDCVKIITDHKGPISRISTLPGSDVFATGSSDGTVRIWKLVHDPTFSSVEVEALQTITLSPKYFPLNLALAKLDDDSIILAVAGTRATIQVFISQDTQFQLAATLTGHEGWIRALEFVRETQDPNSDLLLASASQDKYIRLWRVHRGEELPAVSSALNDPALGVLGKSLSNKAHRIESASAKYSITFEALLLGHEDWIYTASWRHRDGKLQLLSTSEDNSLSIWESDPSSGVWVCTTRLGEISAQKGSTSATGSAGGFWIGLWSPDSNSVVSLGRTGSWRKWTYSSVSDMWTQQVAITGHTREVRGVCWSRDGSYLLSTSSDQTTRLFSEWKRKDGTASWHEFSRPQIHGYDLNCISTTTSSQFLSGADEKLLRVFDLPKGVASILNNLCGSSISTTDSTQDAANIPVLGLSNKAITAISDEPPTEATANADEDAEEGPDPASTVKKSTLELAHPPFEDHLARHLLWPETEKLYGHGYEISAVATSHDGSLVATACRASSLDHAVIRLYDTKEWLEVKPPLKAHSLTVTGLAFSDDDKFLLSVGRDRQWVVWQRDAEDKSRYAMYLANPKGHSRMILGAAWAPTKGLRRPTFLTAGRDKSVKIWEIHNDGDGIGAPDAQGEDARKPEARLSATVPADVSVTAVECLPRILADGRLVFAFGTESGGLGVATAAAAGETEARDALTELRVEMVDGGAAPGRTVNQVAWRPSADEHEGAGLLQLAVASDDSSVRVYNVGGL
ncbi:RNA polymeras-like protein II Elongator subunit [Corynespora cassiicola Philippines]|uniref:Elongator complex protein 2 n=1 Tax=Corynespora cassiicola Philippines TaxID=1448308 RepID=A0A2T2NJZ8_CORCC|nr:RNA polymeras-like protein II Elongator subunit [Corynespora cassiicola Philippines]